MHDHFGTAHPLPARAALPTLQSIYPVPKAFTLVELLMALLILSIIGLIGITSLQSMLKTEKTLLLKQEELSEMLNTLTFLEVDLKQWHNSPTWFKEGNSAAFTYQKTPFYLSFTQNGRINPDALQEKSQIQRIVYQWQNGSIERTSYKDGTVPKGTHITRKILWHDIEDIKVLFHFNKTADTSPEQYTIDTEHPLPQAISFSFLKQGNWVHKTVALK